MTPTSPSKPRALPLVSAVIIIGIFGYLGWNLWTTTTESALSWATDHYACSVYGKLDRTSPAVRNGSYISARVPGIFCWSEDANNQEIVVPYGPGQHPYLAGVPTQADLDQGKALADAYTAPAIATVTAMNNR